MKSKGKGEVEKKVDTNLEAQSEAPKEITEEVVQEVVDLSAARDAEIIPVVKEMMKVMAEATETMPMGVVGVREDKLAVFYQTFYQEVLIPILKKHNLKVKDLAYLFTLMQQPYQLLQDVTMNSFDVNRDLAEASFYKIKDIDDLRINDLDGALNAIGKKASPQSVDKEVE